MAQSSEAAGFKLGGPQRFGTSQNLCNFPQHGNFGLGTDRQQQVANLAQVAAQSCFRVMANTNPYSSLQATVQKKSNQGSDCHKMSVRSQLALSSSRPKQQNLDLDTQMRDRKAEHHTQAFRRQSRSGQSASRSMQTSRQVRLEPHPRPHVRPASTSATFQPTGRSLPSVPSHITQAAASMRAAYYQRAEQLAEASHSVKLVQERAVERSRRSIQLAKHHQELADEDTESTIKRPQRKKNKSRREDWSPYRRGPPPREHDDVLDREGKRHSKSTRMTALSRGLEARSTKARTKASTPLAGSRSRSRQKKCFRHKRSGPAAVDASLQAPSSSVAALEAVTPADQLDVVSIIQEAEAFLQAVETTSHLLPMVTPAAVQPFLKLI
eukprot:TRINITY_DN8230_c0_g1_i1.p1 TRINITY_DN8230_c0_g1~~TRINITY_DN8230_c0_g1_i1.p1  ORF type:complete len:382 (+),score=31.61 TRINITY_DN8230_c0_g1_i1:45-1190(+)